jgi:hypothetical protein
MTAFPCWETEATVHESEVVWAMCGSPADREVEAEEVEAGHLSSVRAASLGRRRHGTVSTQNELRKLLSPATSWSRFLQHQQG